MLAKIFPRFVIRNVILNSHYARPMAIELLKQPFGEQQTEFQEVDPKQYYEVKLFGYISSLQPPAQFQNSYEANQYKKACERFRQFNQTLQLTKKMSQYFWQVRGLYLQVQKNISSSNIFNQKVETDQVFEKDVVDCIEKFQKLEQELQAYPEWKNKVLEEIGGMFHMIHNNLEQSQSKRNIFLKLNRQEYFI